MTRRSQLPPRATLGQMVFYGLLALAAVTAVVVLLLVGRIVVRALRAFVKSCWPQS